MGSKSKVTVIIPVYNVEQYLHQCLDSIVNQTYRDLEIIVVDDGSPDSCGEICDEYAAKDDRVVVVHKKNEGVRAARNDGIKLATGEWITFVDSDDWCETNYIEQIMAAKQESADVICGGGYWLEYSQTKRLVSYCKAQFLVNDRKSIEDMMVHITTYGLACDKFYRTNLLKDNQLFYDATSKAFDDIEFNYKALNHAACVIGTPVFGYHYRQIDASISNGYNPQKPQQNYDVIAKMHAYADARHLSTNAVQGIHAAAIGSISVALNCCYFHPANTDSYSKTAKAIQDMKTWPYYCEAIADKDHRGMNKRQIMMQYALRLPWVWPVKILHAAKNKIKQMRE